VRLPFSSAPVRLTLSAAVLNALLLTGCAPDQTAPAANPGKLDLSRYVAVGDNYTAGYSDGGLTLSSQQYSIPSLISQQFALTSSTASFTQPLLPAGTGTGYLRLQSVDANGFPITRLVTNGRATRSLLPTAGACGFAGITDTVFLYQRAASAALPQNLGVPFVRLTQIDSTGLGNEAYLPFFERLFPTSGDNRSYLQVVTDGTANATFFTFSMGLGDVLPYVLSGGSCTSANPTTPVINLMKANVKRILDKVSDNGRRPGIICLAPYSMEQLPILGRGSIARVQALTKPNDTIYIQASTASGVIVVRPMSAKNDYILPSGLAQFGKSQTIALPGGGTVALRYGLHYRNPIKLRDVLDDSEFSRVNQAVTAINEEAVRLADQVYKIPVLNRSVGGANIYDQVSKRISVNGVEYSSDVLKGNFYSLDQYSLTPRGNAIFTNGLLREINRFYGSSIPLLDPNTFPTTSLPQ
jgi:hypothetical protein